MKPPLCGPPADPPPHQGKEKPPQRDLRGLRVTKGKSESQRCRGDLVSPDFQGRAPDFSGGAKCSMPQVNHKNRETSFAILHSIRSAKVSVFPGKSAEKPGFIVKRTSFPAPSRAREVGHWPHACRPAKPASPLASCATVVPSTAPVARASGSWLAPCLSAGLIAQRGRCCAGRSGHGSCIAAWLSRWSSPTAKTPSGTASMTTGWSPCLRSLPWRWRATSRRRWLASMAGRRRPGRWSGRGHGDGYVVMAAAGSVSRAAGASRFGRRTGGLPTPRSIGPRLAKPLLASGGEVVAEMALPDPEHPFVRRPHQRGAGPQTLGPSRPWHSWWRSCPRHPRSAPSRATTA